MNYYTIDEIDVSKSTIRTNMITEGFGVKEKLITGSIGRPSIFTTTRIVVIQME